MNFINNDDFWEFLDKLVSENEIIIDRPKGKPHPKFKEAIYPVDYGYLKNTSSMDGEGIDLWLGSKPYLNVDCILCTVDLLNKDSEIKILIGCTSEEKNSIYEFLNYTNFMKCILIERE